MNYFHKWQAIRGKNLKRSKIAQVRPRVLKSHEVLTVFLTLSKVYLELPLTSSLRKQQRGAAKTKRSRRGQTLYPIRKETGISRI